MNNIIKLILSFLQMILNSFARTASTVKSVPAPLPAPAPQPVTQVTPAPQISEKPMTSNPYVLTLFTIPGRAADAVSGTDFGNSIMNVGATQQREDLILAQYQAGNVPDFMRNPLEVTVTVGTNTLTYYVLPDVLCVGSDTDYLRTPLNPLTAQKVANLFSCSLPTKKMADQIWHAATVKLTPSPNGPPYDGTMQTTAKMVEHNARVQASLGGRIPGELVTGHKKDVVICAHLLADPSRVAIYGWFYPTGAPIQGLNPSSHDRLYKDYSHGLRMVNRTMTLNGSAVDFFDILKDPSTASLLSDEGHFDATNIYK